MWALKRFMELIFMNKEKDDIMFSKNLVYKIILTQHEGIWMDN